jgi:hypothetical protein
MLLSLQLLNALLNRRSFVLKCLVAFVLIASPQVPIQSAFSQTTQGPSNALRGIYPSGSTAPSNLSGPNVNPQGNVSEDLAKIYTSNPLGSESYPTDPSVTPQESESLAEQAAEQDANVTSWLSNILIPSTDAPPWVMNILNDIITQTGKVVQKWIKDFNHGWAAPTASTLSVVLYQEVFNPNVAVLSQSQTGTDTVTQQIQHVGGIIYTIAQDLLLIMFILTVWKFTADAAWRGGHAMGAVGRLIFTAMLLMAWPDIYAFIIQISNELINAIYPQNGTQGAAQLANAIMGAIDAGAVATTAAFVSMLAPVAGTLAGSVLAGGIGGAAGGMVGGAIGFVADVVFIILATIVVFELLYVIILKTIQIILLFAQFMFAPMFLLFFVHPETENIAIGYMRAVVEVSLWSFVWVGLLRLLSIVMSADYAIWGEILLSIGVLQVMISVPEFIAHARISPASDFLTSGLLDYGVIRGMRGMVAGGQHLFERTAGYFGSQRLAASDIGRSTVTSLPNLAAGGNAALLGGMAAASAGGQPFTGGTIPPGAGGPPMGPGGRPGTPPASGGPSALAGLTGAGAAPAGFRSGMLGAPTGGPVRPGVGGMLAALGTGAVLGAALGGESSDSLTSRFPPARYDEKGNVYEPTKDLAKNIFDRKGVFINYKTPGNYIHSDADGNTHIGVRAGANAMEIGRLHNIAAFSKLIEQDPIAKGAARQAAINAGEDKPVGFGERVAAGIMAHHGRSYKTSQNARQNFQQGMARQAVLGATAYVGGEAGNAFTQHLVRRFGPWTPEMDARSAYLATNMDDPNSGYHPAYSPATRAVLDSGVLFTDPARAAAANPHVMATRPYQRKHAILAVAKISEDLAKAQNPGASQHVLEAAIGRIAMSMGPEMVAAATAIQLESGGRDVSYQTVENVNSLWASRYVRDPGAAYHVLDAAVKGMSGTAPGRGAVYANVQVPNQFDYSRATGFIQNMAMSGFPEALMRSPDVVHVAYQLSHEGGGNIDLPVIATAYRALGESHVNEANIHTVDSMINSGWRSRDIERPSIWTAEALVNSGYHPTRRLVNLVMEQSSWHPAPNQSLTPEIHSMVDDAMFRRRGS